MSVQARLHLPADQHLTQAESGICRALYDCPDQSLGKTGKLVRIIVATHPAGATKSRVGVTRAGVVSELFLTDLPQSAFAADGFHTECCVTMYDQKVLNSVQT